MSTSPLSQQDHPPTSTPEIEVVYLHHRWHQIKKSLAYHNFLEAPWWMQAGDRLRTWQALAQETRDYTDSKSYRVSSHALKKDLMELFGVPEGQIRVQPKVFSYPTEPVKSENESATAWPVDSSVQHRQHRLVLPLPPNLQNGLYSVMSTLVELRKNHIENLQLCLQESPLKRRIIRVAQKLGIASQVHFYDPSLQQTAELKGADLVLLPSLYHPQEEALWHVLHGSQAPVLISKGMGGIEALPLSAHSYLIDPFATSNVWLEAIWLSLHDRDLRCELMKIQSQALGTDQRLNQPDHTPVKEDSEHQQKPIFMAK